MAHFMSSLVFSRSGYLELDQDGTQGLALIMETGVNERSVNEHKTKRKTLQPEGRESPGLFRAHSA